MIFEATKLTKLATVVAATAALAIALPATARADIRNFQSPSGKHRLHHRRQWRCLRYQ
jgi:hypothetical protein